MHSNWLLRDLHNNRITTLKRPKVTVGRSNGADILSVSTTISREHAELVVLEDGQLYVEDKGSSNGTYINDEKILSGRRIMLKNNDQLSFGSCRRRIIENPDPNPLSYLLFKVIYDDDVVIVNEAPVTPLDVDGEGERSLLPDVDGENNDQPNEINVVEELGLLNWGEEPHPDPLVIQLIDNMLNGNDAGSSDNESNNNLPVSKTVDIKKKQQEENPAGSHCAGEKHSAGKCFTEQKSKLDTQTTSETVPSTSRQSQISESEALVCVKNEPSSSIKTEVLDFEIKDSRCSSIKQESLDSSFLPVCNPSTSIAYSVASISTVNEMKVEPEDDVNSEKAKMVIEKSTLGETCENSVLHHNAAIAEEYSDGQISKPAVPSPSDTRTEGISKPLINKAEDNQPVSNFSISEDFVVVSDDEDDIFACSQLVHMAKVKMEIKEEPNVDAEYNEVIKNLEKLDYKNELLRDSPTLIELDNYYEDDDELLDQLEFSQKLDEHLAQIDEQTETSNKVTNPVVILRQWPVEHFDHGKLNEKEDKKSKFIKPPIIEAHFIKPPSKTSKPSKRKNVEEIKMVEEKKLKIQDVSSKHLNTKRKKTKSPKTDNKYINKQDRHDIKKTRGEKLKELANKSRKSETERVSKQPTKAKVKVSDGRGNFLLENPTENKKRKNNEGGNKNIKCKKTTPKKDALAKKNYDVPDEHCIVGSESERGNSSNDANQWSKRKQKAETVKQDNVSKLKQNAEAVEDITTPKQKTTVIQGSLNEEVRKKATNLPNGHCQDVINRDAEKTTNLKNETKANPRNAANRQSFDGDLPAMFLPSQVDFASAANYKSPLSSPDYSNCSGSPRYPNNIQEVRKLMGVISSTVYSSDIVKSIVCWNHKWLLDQKNIPDTPPVSNIHLEKLPDRFNCYLDYVKIMSSLTLLEAWRYIYDEWTKQKRDPFKVQVVHQRAVTNISFIDCEVVGDYKTLANSVRENYVLLVEMRLKRGNQKIQQTNFGIVTRSQMNFVNDPQTGKAMCKLSFTIAMKLDGMQMTHNHLFVQILTNLTHYVGLAKNMKALEKSPIKQRILQPSLDNFSYEFDDFQPLDVGSARFLNATQSKIVKEAVQVCTKNQGIYLIRGPPGTGKSTVLVNIVLQILLGEFEETPRILLTAPSNAAVDELVYKLSSARDHLSEKVRKRIKIVRIGPEQSIHSHIKNYSLKTHTLRQMIQELKERNPEFHAEYEKLSLACKALEEECRCLAGKNLDNKDVKKRLDLARSELDKETFLRKRLRDYNYRRKSCEATMLQGCNVLCTTLNSCVNRTIENSIQSTQIKPFYFTCCIVDEATQCNEIEALTPLQLGIERFILVGDPQQLPATVLNMEAKRLQFGMSLFTRLTRNFDNPANTPVRTLCEQYRMPKEIVDFPNRRFYNKQLVTRTNNIKNKITPAIVPYLVFNLMYNPGTQYQNTDEIDFVQSLVRVIVSTVSPRCHYSIGIITPYNLQKDALNEALLKERRQNVFITVNTVDSFQGKEEDIIIISCVRHMPNNFLADPNRLNVALTRAKQALFVVGTYELFKHCNVLYDLRENAKVRKLCRNIPKLHEYLPYMANEIFYNLKKKS